MLAPRLTLEDRGKGNENQWILAGSGLVNLTLEEALCKMIRLWTHSFNVHCSKVGVHDSWIFVKYTQHDATRMRKKQAQWPTIPTDDNNSELNQDTLCHLDLADTMHQMHPPQPSWPPNQIDPVEEELIRGSKLKTKTKLLESRVSLKQFWQARSPEHHEKD